MRARAFAIAIGLSSACAVVACGGHGCHTSVSKGWDASYSVSFGGSTSDAAIATVAPPSSSASSAPLDASAASDSGLTGIFHLDVGPDERNLSIDPDGTFFWRIYGCDFSGGACGVWAVDGTSLVLTPAYGAKTMAWDDGVTFSREVTKVVVHDKGTFLEARAFTADGAKLVQLWYPGRICAPCGGGEGPSGKLYACAKPLVRSCR